MMVFDRFRQIWYGIRKNQPVGGLFHPLEYQLRCWKRANRIMRWGIDKAARQAAQDLIRPVASAPESFIGTGLFYGFGEDGYGHADPILSGRLAWEYAKRRREKTWQCEYISFHQEDRLRLRPQAPSRPRGFYLAALDLGHSLPASSVAAVRKQLRDHTGFGPEGLQLLCITQPHLLDLMNVRKIPFLALADYDIAPYGFNDFYDAPQIFCSLGTVGLGMGNVDRHYPGFAIGCIRLL